VSTWSAQVIKVLEPSVVVVVSLLSPPSVGTVTVFRAFISLVGHHMLAFVRYERRRLIYTNCHIITSHKLSR